MSILISFFFSSDVPCSKFSLEPRSATRCSCEQVKILNSFNEPKTLNLVHDNIKLRTWSNSNLALNTVPHRACPWQTSPQSFWTIMESYWRKKKGKKWEYEITCILDYMRTSTFCVRHSFLQKWSVIFYKFITFQLYNFDKIILQ